MQTARKAIVPSNRRPVLGTAAAFSGPILALALGAAAQEAPGPGTIEPAAPRLLVEGARTVDWAPKGDWIAYDRLDHRGFSQLYVARPDGSTERCLTCDHYPLRKHHAASPAWHPSGRYIVFVLERPVNLGGEPLPFRSVPGGNRGSDLWVITLDGKVYWNLTNRADRGGRVLSPHFSHEGDRLVWSERLAAGGGAWGRWSLQVAEFGVKRGVPRLRKARSFRPGERPRFCEASGFTPDDRGLLFSANPDPGQNEATLDLFVLRLETGEIARLTDSTDLDVAARWAPDGRHLVWASNRDLRIRKSIYERSDRQTATPLDLWRMRTDGTGKERLTWFNDATSPGYYGRVMVGAPVWSREGDRMIVPVVPVDGGSGGGLFLLEPAPTGPRSGPPTGVE